MTTRFYMVRGKDDSIEIRPVAAGHKPPSEPIFAESFESRELAESVASYMIHLEDKIAMLSRSR